MGGRKRRLDLGESMADPDPKRKVDPTVNSYTGKPYSNQYYTILEKRKQLPVWEQRDQFLQLVRDNQVVVLEGETGSGKTTQVHRQL
jgi:HrpA-like RNA helicase